VTGEVPGGERDRPLRRRQLRPAVDEVPQVMADDRVAPRAEQHEQRAVGVDDAAPFVGQQHPVARLLERAREQGRPAGHRPILPRDGNDGQAFVDDTTQAG